MNLGKNGTIGYVSRELHPTSKHTQLTQLHPCKVSHTQAAPGCTGKQCRNLVTLSHLESHWHGETLVSFSRQTLHRQRHFVTCSVHQTHQSSDRNTVRAPSSPCPKKTTQNPSKNSTWEQTFLFSFLDIYFHICFYVWFSSLILGDPYSLSRLFSAPQMPPALPSTQALVGKSAVNQSS